MAIWRPPPRAQQPKNPVFIPPTLGIGDSLRAFWKFLEAPGNTRNDSAGSNHAAEVGGSVGRTSPGKVGDAAFFNETNYLRVFDNPEISITGNMSIWGWPRRSADLSTGTFPGIVSKWGAGDQRSYGLWYEETINRFRMAASPDGTFASAVIVTHPLVPSIGVYYFLQGYVDLDADLIGIRVGTSFTIGTWATEPYTAPGIFNSTADLEIGRLGTAANIWHGDIDAAGLAARRYSETNWNTLWNNGNGLEVVTPVAKAGLDLTRKELETIYLDGSQSIGDGISYSWSQVSGTPVSLANSTTPQPHFTGPDVSVPEELVFELEITETDLDTDTDQVTLRIVPSNSTEWLGHTPFEAGIDPDLFYPIVEAMPAPSMVFRDGRIVGVNGDITLEGFIWSASKCLTALIAGRQLQLGNIALTDLVPDSDFPTIPEATVRHFLTMMSDYGLTPHSPGNNYGYNNGAYSFFGTWLRDTFYNGQTYVQMLMNAYGTAIGIEDTVTFNGTTSGWDGGWSISTRDFGRINQLVLNRGVWNGVQLIHPVFCDGLFMRQVPNTAAENTNYDDIFYNQAPAFSTDVFSGFSQGLWLPHLADLSHLPGGLVNSEVASMSGAFGTSSYISRNKRLIAASANVGGTTTNDPEIKIKASTFNSLLATLAPESIPIFGQILAGD